MQSVVVHIPSLPPVQNLVERHPPLEAGQVGAEAVVRPWPKVRCSMSGHRDVVAVWILVTAGIRLAEARSGRTTLPAGRVVP